MPGNGLVYFPATEDVSNYNEMGSRKNLCYEDVWGITWQEVG